MNMMIDNRMVIVEVISSFIVAMGTKEMETEYITDFLAEGCSSAESLEKQPAASPLSFPTLWILV